MASRSTQRAKAPGLRLRLGSMWRQSIWRGWRSAALACSRWHSKTFTPPSQASRCALCNRTFSRCPAKREGTLYSTLLALNTPNLLTRASTSSKSAVRRAGSGFRQARSASHARAQRALSRRTVSATNCS